MRHVGVSVPPVRRRSHPPQCVEETLHAVGRLLLQHLDAALHLQVSDDRLAQK